jgi:hypothetical protein
MMWRFPWLAREWNTALQGAASQPDDDGDDTASDDDPLEELDRCTNAAWFSRLGGRYA